MRCCILLQRQSEEEVYYDSIVTTFAHVGEVVSNFDPKIQR